MAVTAMKLALFDFKYTENICILKECKYTAGLALLVEYYRGHIAPEDIPTALFYADRFDALCGKGHRYRNLAPYGHPCDWDTIEEDNRFHERILMNHVIQKLYEEDKPLKT